MENFKKREVTITATCPACKSVKQYKTRQGYTPFCNICLVPMYVKKIISKTIAVLAVLILFSCNQPGQVTYGAPLDSSTQVAASANTVSYVPTYTMHLKETDSIVRVLIIEYYKAGWMEASNHLIDLYNTDAFTKQNIKMLKNTDWRQIEAKVSSVKPFQK